MKIETGKANPYHSHTSKDITAQAIAILIEATLDCNTGIDTVTTEAAHYNLAQPRESTATESHHDMPHQLHHRSSQHRSSSGYRCQDHSRSHHALLQIFKT